MATCIHGVDCFAAGAATAVSVLILADWLWSSFYHNTSRLYWTN